MYVYAAAHMLRSKIIAIDYYVMDYNTNIMQLEILAICNKIAMHNYKYTLYKYLSQQ